MVRWADLNFMALSTARSLRPRKRASFTSPNCLQHAARTFYPSSTRQVFRSTKYEFNASGGRWPKMATFHGNVQSPCPGCPGWKPVARLTSIMTCLGHPGVLRTEERAREKTKVEHQPSCKSRRQKPASLGNRYRSWKSVNIDDHDHPPSPFTPCRSSLEAPRSSGTRRRRSDVEVWLMLHVAQGGKSAIFGIFQSL